MEFSGGFSITRSGRAKTCGKSLVAATLIPHFAPESKIELPNYPIGSGQDIGWNGHTDLLGSFQIDQQLELGRLLDG